MAHLLRVDVVVHWLHLMAAMVWVGGMVATALVVQPAARRMLGPEARMALYKEIGRRFVVLQWGSWTVLLLTGAYKVLAWRGAWVFFWGAYGKVLSVKLFLVAVMALLSLLHSHVWGPQLATTPPESPQFKPLVAKLAFWGKVNLACLAGIVYCAALLRVYPW